MSECYSYFQLNKQLIPAEKVALSDNSKILEVVEVASKEIEDGSDITFVEDENNCLLVFNTQYQLGRKKIVCYTKIKKRKSFYLSIYLSIYPLHFYLLNRKVNTQIIEKNEIKKVNLLHEDNNISYQRKKLKYIFDRSFSTLFKPATKVINNDSNVLQKKTYRQVIDKIMQVPIVKKNEVEKMNLLQKDNNVSYQRKKLKYTFDKNISTFFKPATKVINSDSNILKKKPYRQVIDKIMQVPISKPAAKPARSKAISIKTPRDIHVNNAKPKIKLRYPDYTLFVSAKDVETKIDISPKRDAEQLTTHPESLRYPDFSLYCSLFDNNDSPTIEHSSKIQIDEPLRYPDCFTHAPYGIYTNFSAEISKTEKFSESLIYPDYSLRNI